MPRKKRIAIIISSIILVVLIILAILGYLYLKTDIFKSNETLFAKYLIQNFDTLEILKIDKSDENTLNSKYISELEGKIEYTENIGTSDENKDNPINKVVLKIKNNTDETNDYNYSNVSIESDDQKLIGLELLKENQTFGVRLNGIQQFVSVENNENELLEKIEIVNIENLTSKIDIASILNFSDEEKQNLANTYLNVIQTNVSKDKYYKQLNTLITVDDKDVQTNSYYIKFTIEEYNNLCIKILEQIINDENILSRIDLLEEQIKEADSNYENEESFRQTFIDNINNKIKEIQDNNIGNDEVKITVYENNMQTVRTSIEKTSEKTTIDLYNDSSIKINNIQIDDDTKEQSIKIEKNNKNISINLEKIQNNEMINNIQLDYQEITENNNITKIIELGIANQKYEGIISLVNNIENVEEFENKITLDTDNVKLNDLQQEQIDTIISILNENIQSQLSDLNIVVNLENYTKMLQNLGVINKTSVQLPSDGEVTEIEKTRFNAQFEFFVSENLTSDNIKELLETTENNCEDIKVLMKTGEIEDLDIEKLNSYQDGNEYKKNIDEILIYIKGNYNNEEKQQNILDFIEDNRNNKYTVSIEYDDNGLTRVIRAKIQEN